MADSRRAVWAMSSSLRPGGGVHIPQRNDSSAVLMPPQLLAMASLRCRWRGHDLPLGGNTQPALDARAPAQSCSAAQGQSPPWVRRPACRLCGCSKTRGGHAHVHHHRMGYVQPKSGGGTAPPVSSAAVSASITPKSGLRALSPSAPATTAAHPARLSRAGAV